MDKNQVISFIQSQLSAGNISNEDLRRIAAGPEVAGATPIDVTSNSNKLTQVFYGIGAVIAFVGVVILVAQNWDEIGFAGRILVTLGISLVTYISGMLIRKPEHKIISQVMYGLSAILAPLGVYVLLEQANVDFTSTIQLITALILFVIFGFATYVSKRNLLFVITVAFASWAYYALIVKIFGFGYDNTEYFKWASMLLGAAYLFLGYGFRSLWSAVDPEDLHEKSRVQKIFYGLGTLFILGGGIAIGGMFDLFFILLIFAAFYGSVYLRSRAMLIFAALFLMGHIIKLTSKHFVNSIGWPVALIVVGFFVIGIGYLTVYLNKRYIAK